MSSHYHNFEPCETVQYDGSNAEACGRRWLGPFEVRHTRSGPWEECG